MQTLNGTIALVTGASRGVGKSVALELIVVRHGLYQQMKVGRSVSVRSRPDGSIGTTGAKIGEKP